MRVLWVEDLGGDAKSSGLVEKLKGWLDDSVLDYFPEISPGLSWDYATWRKHYQECPTSNSNEVDFCVDLDVLIGLLSSKATVERYDFILIDIDLTGFSGSGKEWQCPDPANGGFWVYHKFIRLGFPPERLAFLTGNGDKAIIFAKKARELMLDEPLSFDKTTYDVSDWLIKACRDDYLRFRRGVIEGCLFLSSNIKVHVSNFYRFVPVEDRPDIDLAGYLESISFVLPATMYGHTKKHVVRHFLRALGWIWEGRSQSGNIKETDLESVQLKAIGWTMKCLRNWSSHGHLLDRAEFEDVALFVMLNFRALSFVGADIRPYEKLLYTQSDSLPPGKVKSLPRASRDRMRQMNEGYRHRHSEENLTNFHHNSMLNDFANWGYDGLNYVGELRKVYWNLLAENHGGYSLELKKYPLWVKELANATLASTFKDEVADAI